MASTVEKYKLGSQATLLSTELDSLANNTNALGSTFNNAQGGGGGDGYTLCDLELLVSYSSAPAASTGCTLWLLGTLDDTNFEDGASGVTPARLPDATFPVRAVTGAQRILRRLWLPWGSWKPLLRNDATGVAMASSGNVLKVRPVTREGVQVA